MQQKPKAEWQAPDLLLDAYWKRPQIDFAHKGAPNEETIATAVGLALSMWQRVEESLCELFMEFIHGPMAMRVFGAVRSSSDRRGMILAAAQIHFDYYWSWDDVRNPVTSIIAAVNAASDRRDDIAHGRIREFIFNDEDRGLFLSSTVYDWSRNEIRVTPDREFVVFERHHYRYKFDDVMSFTAKLRELEAYITEYCSSIQRDGDGLPQNVEQIRMRNASGQ